MTEPAFPMRGGTPATRLVPRRRRAPRPPGAGTLPALNDLFAAVITALVISTMALSLAAMFRPQWLMALKPVICPPGTRLQLRNASPVPGELVLDAWCLCEDRERDVSLRLVSTAMGVLFVPVMILSWRVIRVRRRRVWTLAEHVQRHAIRPRQSLP